MNNELQDLRITATRLLFRKIENIDVKILRYIALGLADNLILGWTMNSISQSKEADILNLYELIGTQLPGSDLSDSDDALRSLVKSIEEGLTR